MELTTKQKEGLQIILDRHAAQEKYTVVAGYAGTGKSTLVRFAIEALKIEEGRVAYATFTGKAAEVLRKKGNPGACTLHRLLYDHVPMPGGGFLKRPKKSLGVDAVIVDEISMVPKSMIDMLLNYQVYIIFLGDPFQLPSISKEDAHDLLQHPHVFLDEIMRQAAESEIIQLTMKIRAGEPIENFKGNEVQIFSKDELNTGMLTWADQIICATNASRHSLNNQMRQMLGFSGPIQDGEKIILKRNYWDDCNDDGDALVNGSVGIIKNPFESFRRIPHYIKNDRHDLPIIVGDFIPECGASFGGIEFDKDYLLTETPCVDWRVSYQLGKLKNKIGDVLPRQMTYGYAITCHAAQGSEWDKVLVIEERFPFDKTEHARWLYTACTRAAEKLVLIRG